jgi:hypothetical protein
MAQSYKQLPEAALLRELLTYNPLTGKLLWRIKTSDKVVVDQEVGTINKMSGYIRVMINRSDYAAHRLVWKWLYGYDPAQLDHANGNRADNRSWNLRECTGTENQGNTGVRRNNKSGLKGVYRQPGGARRKPWVAKIMRQTIGYYATPEEAHAAYCAKATELFGQFHRPA